MNSGHSAGSQNQMAGQHVHVLCSMYAHDFHKFISHNVHENRGDSNNIKTSSPFVFHLYTLEHSSGRIVS
jgi:hypothetical protein